MVLILKLVSAQKLHKCTLLLHLMNLLFLRLFTKLIRYICRCFLWQKHHWTLKVGQLNSEK